MNENKTNINWLITIYPRIRESLDKIKACEKQHLAHFNKKYVKNLTFAAKTRKPLL